MAYTINNTAGTTLKTLADGTIDTATTDLTLIGKGYAGFGERLNENFVKLLENFSNTSAPANKIKGQLWYDSLNNQINVYTGNKFKPVGSTTNSATAPTNAVLGDMWFDTANTQLYIYTGTAWTLIGPTTVSGSGITQVVSEAIEDNVGVQKSILRFVTNDTNVAIVSAEEFTPGTAISGFATIKKGITLSSAISGNKLEGTSTDSDALGGVAAANYLRSNANDTTSGTLGVLNDDGITIGSGSDITMKLSSDDFTIAQTTQDKDIIFTVNDGGSTTEVMRLDGANSTLKVKDLEVTGTQTIFNTTKLTVEDNIIEVNRNISNAAAMPNFSGLKINRGATSTVTEQDLYWVWDETFADDGTTTFGNAGGAFTAFKSGGGDEMSAPTLVDLRANVVHATSTAAQYADLAERYAADEPMEVGDVVELGGSQEITKCVDEKSTRVFGVVSEAPAFLMNKDAGNNDSHPMIALKGRVRVKVKGPGHAGERLVSAGNGEAKVAKLDECTAFSVIGRLIKTKYSSITELTECVIGVK
tara:strand:+ start:344 stop:1936 length:1593 start_codon:yes stop_codon:yes gene_type:complete